MKTIATEQRHTVITANLMLCLRFSFIIAAAYTGIFLLANVLGLEKVTELRFINYLLLFIVIYSAIKKYYIEHQKKIEYFTGFGLAFLTGILGQFWYSFLFFIYLHFNSSFMNYIANHFPARILYPELSISVALLSEGIGFSAIVALAVMQYFKRKRGRWVNTSS
jgi:hypothetical protein